MCIKKLLSVFLALVFLSIIPASAKEVSPRIEIPEYRYDRDWVWESVKYYQLNNVLPEDFLEEFSWMPEGFLYNYYVLPNNHHDSEIFMRGIGADGTMLAATKDGKIINIENDIIYDNEYTYLGFVYQALYAPWTFPHCPCNYDEDIHKIYCTRIAFQEKLEFTELEIELLEIYIAIRSEEFENHRLRIEKFESLKLEFFRDLFWSLVEESR